jgi:hypothetical protein
MAYASITYTSASGTTFALTNSNGDPIEYLRQADIKVFLNGTLQVVTTDYTFNTAGTAIVFNTAVSGATVVIQRITDVDLPAVNFTPGSTLAASDLNNSSDQTLFGLQELRDEISFGGGVSDGDKGDIFVASGGTVWSIDTGVVTESKIGTGAVTETKLGTGSVTETKIGTGAVTSSKILNETIVDTDINPSAAITGTKIQAATTSNSGTVQLTDSTSSTSTSTAATPNSVKTAYDLANTANTTAGTANTTANAALPKAGGTMTGVITYATAQPRLIRETAVATTSGSTVNFTGLPSWIKRFTVVLDNVSVTGTDHVLIQLGDSGGIETTGYISTAIFTSYSPTASGGAFASTSGIFVTVGAPQNLSTGSILFDNISGNRWIASGMYNFANLTTTIGWSAGEKTLSATLDRVRIIVEGTDTFDNGSVNIMYEG